MNHALSLNYRLSVCMKFNAGIRSNYCQNYSLNWHKVESLDLVNGSPRLQTSYNGSTGCRQNGAPACDEGELRLQTPRTPRQYIDSTTPRVHAFVRFCSSIVDTENLFDLRYARIVVLQLETVHRSNRRMFVTPTGECSSLQQENVRHPNRRRFVTPTGECSSLQPENDRHSNRRMFVTPTGD